MSKVDLWARIEAATERAEDMARAERAYTRMRRAGVSEDTIQYSRVRSIQVHRDTDVRETGVIRATATIDTYPPPAYVDEDGPEVVLGEGLGAWIGWPERKGVRR